MTESQQIAPRILLTTDFSEASRRAFHHALAVALAKRARLTVLHTGSESRQDVPWEKFPGVRETLTRWGLLEEGAPRNAVADQLDLHVAKMAMRDDDPRQGITDYLRRHPTDLLVMATRGRRGWARIFNASVAETVAYNTRSNTLLLPVQSEGFVAAGSGQAGLRKVLCMLEPEGDSERMLGFLGGWLPAFGGGDAEILLARIAGERDEPMILPADGRLQWRQEVHEGTPIDVIMPLARSFEPDLLVISTQTLLTLRGRLRGSIADKVLRSLGIPMLTIPRA